MGLTNTFISVVIPVYFQENGLRELHSRLTKVLTTIPNIDYEIILVNDGSLDNSFKVIQKISEVDKRVIGINFSRNFGQQMAATAGFKIAKGDAVILMDDDLQDPPEVIPQMLQKWQEGFKVVYGVRKNRKGENIFKIVSAKLFYRFIHKLSDVKLPIDVGDFRLMDKKVVDVLKDMKEESRYLRGLVSWVGFTQCGVPYERDNRFVGKTNYSVAKLVRFALNGVTSFSDRPLIIGGQMGLIVTAISFILLIIFVLMKIFTPQYTITGWTSTIVIIIFLGGIQLSYLGILGQYIGRILREVRGRPLYVIDETCGISNQTPKGH